MAKLGRGQKSKIPTSKGFALGKTIWGPHTIIQRYSEDSYLVKNEAALSLNKNYNSQLLVMKVHYFDNFEGSVTDWAFQSRYCFPSAIKKGTATSC